MHQAGRRKVTMFGFKKKKKNIDRTNSILNEDSSWEVKEAYKTLRTNVMFSIDGENTKVIGVTSAMPHDGKTVNAINHAISFAQIGKNVIVIDADMRLPTVAGKLRMSQKYGLSNFLAGQKKLQECIKKNKLLGIDVLSSGTLPPDPTWLLQSPRFGEMLSELKKEYDYIIIDLPPVITVADSYIISPHIDGYLLVVRSGQTDVRAIADMMEQLSMAEAKVIGFVDNDVQSRKNDYYYGNSYGYYNSPSGVTEEL